MLLVAASVMHEEQYKLTLKSYDEKQERSGAPFYTFFSWGNIIMKKKIKYLV